MVGVYFLKQNEKIVYVGQSVDIERRIKEHRDSNKVFDDYTYVECEKELLNSTEEAFILQHNPVYNIRKATIKVYPESLIKNYESQNITKMNIKLSKEVFEKVEIMSRMMNMPKSQCVNLLVSQWLEDRKNKDK